MPSLLTAVTVSELLYQLGDIPPERVRLQPTPGTATEADVVAVHDQEDRLCELVDGVLVEKTMGYYESYIAATLIRLIGNFVVEHDLGIVAGADGMMRLAPGLVRIPDVSFVSWEKLPGRRLPRQLLDGQHERSRAGDVVDEQEPGARADTGEDGLHDLVRGRGGERQLDDDDEAGT